MASTSTPPTPAKCGNEPTEWKLETQFFHADGITPINGYFRRSLTDATVSDVVTTSLHVNATEDEDADAGANASHRALQSGGYGEAQPSTMAPLRPRCRR